jgi:hypothetical protein
MGFLPAVIGFAIMNPPRAEATRRRASLSFVIPGRAKREPGIHTPDRGYGFRACAKRRIPE